MKLAMRACAALVGVVPIAMANPDLVNDQRIYDPAQNYMRPEMEDGTLVLVSYGTDGPCLRVFERDELGLWGESQEPIAGVSGAIDMEGGLIAVTNMTAQRLWILQRDPSTGDFVVSIELQDPEQVPNGNFGWSVSTDGVRVAVGRAGAAYQHDCAWVFEQTANGKWLGTKIEQPYGGAANLAFGRGIAIEGDTLLVAAPYLLKAMVPPADTLPGEGAVYVYQRQADGSWLPDAVEPRLWDDLGQSGQTENFGNWLDIDQGTLVVTSEWESGAVLVYHQDAAGHFGKHPNARLVSPPGVESKDGFGSTASVQGDLIAVGSPKTYIAAGKEQGAIFLFERENGAWSLGSPLGEVFATPAADDDFDHLGGKVDLDGELLCADRPVFGIPPAVDAGSVHVFSGPFAVKDVYYLPLDPNAKYTGLSIGAHGVQLMSLFNQWTVILDWHLPLLPAPPVNDLVPPIYKNPRRGKLTVEIVKAPDPTRLIPDDELAQYPDGFVWNPANGGFILIPASGFQGKITFDYVWCLEGKPFTNPATVVVIVGEGRAGRK